MKLIEKQWRSGWWCNDVTLKQQFTQEKEKVNSVIYSPSTSYKPVGVSFFYSNDDYMEECWKLLAINFYSTFFFFYYGCQWLLYSRQKKETQRFGGWGHDKDTFIWNCSNDPIIITFSLMTQIDYGLCIDLFLRMQNYPLCFACAWGECFEHPVGCMMRINSHIRTALKRSF